MNQEAPLPTLNAAIAAVRARGLVAVKTARNTGINSDYASYADVWEVLKPELEATGLSVGFLLGPVRRDEAAWVQTLTLEVSTAEDLRSSTFEFCFPEGNRGVNLSQRQGMAQTYARRYALVSFFHIITGDDDDAQRLGMEPRTDMAVKPKDDAQWSDFCYAPFLGLGIEETQGAWSNLADPSGDGSSVLGDFSSKVIGEMTFKFVDNIGLKAWMAEVANDRAGKLQLTTWEAVRAHCKTLRLPDSAAACSGDQLRTLSSALRPVKA